MTAPTTVPLPIPSLVADTIVTKVVDDQIYHMTSTTAETFSLDKMVILRSSDGNLFTVSKEVSFATSATLQGILENSDEFDQAMDIPDASSDTLGKSIIFMEYHYKEKDHDQMRHRISNWDLEFFSHVLFDKVTDPTVITTGPIKNRTSTAYPRNAVVMFALIRAANFLRIEKLTDVGCKYVAQIIVENPVEKIREVLGIVNDFTPEEEAQVIEENKLAAD